MLSVKSYLRAQVASDVKSDAVFTYLILQAQVFGCGWRRTQEDEVPRRRHSFITHHSSAFILLWNYTDTPADENNEQEERIARGLHGSGPQFLYIHLQSPRC